MVKRVITLKRRPGMTHDEFVQHHRNVHRPLLVSIPETRQYVRRFVVSYPIEAPPYPEPSYDAVVEAWFDSMADLRAFYTSDNFRTVVAPDHAAFIDLASVGQIIAEEELVVE